jgi:integrase
MITLARARSRTRHRCVAAGQLPLIATLPGPCMLWRAKGVDIATIALLLGHESTQTTHIYKHADPALKEEAIARTAPLGVKPGRYRPSDSLLAFLDDL